ncbi:MarR family winged helix-turn-helix transcriptional regulator [Christiangramia portivictoriae]|uniref:MarR family winged helix-turn-helix transcriptional regulator n=1 Tax=Christiangramia portivictoriae TaxID=326069 RepID=UPI00041B0545|nr:MarR family transcriptional regulator [Christiangramia portivictoriae]
MKIEDLLKTSNQISETKKLVLNLIVTANHLGDQMQDVLKPFGISPQQFNVLRILRGQKGKPASLGNIQERMVSKMSNTTRLVDKLIDKGLCQRIICPSNRRKVEITITETGQELLKEIDPLVESMENSFSEKLTTQELTDLNYKLNELRNTD